jgi:hypothetical protein
MAKILETRMKINSNLFKHGAALLLAPNIAGCEFLAVQTAAPKRASAACTAAATKADELFWTSLRRGDYANIGTTAETLKQAYLAEPNDAITAAHIGRRHIWRISKRE